MMPMMGPVDYLGYVKSGCFRSFVVSFDGCASSACERFVACGGFQGGKGGFVVD